MPFRYPLQTVLHFRQSLEHQQELRLRAANQQVGKVRHLITQMELASRESRALQLRRLETGLSSAEIRFQMSCEAVVEQHHASLERELVRLEKLRDEQLAIYQRLRRDHETLKGLRDQQLGLYQKEAARSEQRRMDDLFLLRQQYARRG
jgi:flagellar export protein FliJ